MSTSAAPSTKASRSAKSKAKKRRRKQQALACSTKDLRRSKRRGKRRSGAYGCGSFGAGSPAPTFAPLLPDGPPSPAGAAAAPPLTDPSGAGWTPADDDRTDGLRTYRGAFGREQATRLLFRAGFGPTPGQADEFAALGVRAAVERLVHPPVSRLEGPAPSGDYLVGGELAPDDRWGHGHLQWLDRCVRSTDQLTERMALVLHDWIAISDAGAERRHVRQVIQRFRDSWRGSFRDLMQAVTVEPAMLQWLNGLGSGKWAPNENYARELMELFCLGADRGAYTEQDIREMARALTGWVADWSDTQGLHNFRFDSRRFDTGTKTFWAGTSRAISGNFNGRDVVNAVIDHPMHPSYVALRLWSAFIPTPPTPQTLAELEALYRSSGERLEPLVEAILRHPDLYTGPSMTKSPVTYVAGLLRARRRGIEDDGWMWLCQQAGQVLLSPPNVSGWNERAWLNTTTHQARWWGASWCVQQEQLRWEDYRGSTETPQQAVDAALAFWGNPALGRDHRAALDRFAVDAMSTDYWNDAPRRQLRQLALRQLVVSIPDYQVS